MLLQITFVDVQDKAKGTISEYYLAVQKAPCMPGVCLSLPRCYPLSVAALIPMISQNILLHAEKSIFSKAPRLTSANIDGKQTNRSSSVDSYTKLAHGAHLPASNASHPTFPHDAAGTAGMRLEVFSREECATHYCASAECVRLRVCTSVPSAFSRCPHPNHNYNVISRVRQRPCCCFTFSSSSLLWISNALMLSTESCTALSQIHRRCPCECVCMWVHFLWLWQEKPAAGPRF